MRKSWMHLLNQVATQRPELLLLTGDQGYGLVESFEMAHPTRFISLGLADQALAGVAAGLASEGQRVVLHAGRQGARLLPALRELLPGQSVIVVETDSNEPLPHQLPGWLLATPACPQELLASLRQLLARGEPSWLRLGPDGTQPLRGASPTVQLGQWVPLRAEAAPARTALLGSGTGLARTRPLAPQATHFSLPLWGEPAAPFQAEQIARFDELFVTREDGLADWMLRVAADAGLGGRVHPV
ncbi:hypothetical protein [Inhella proteolytica]|uniref:Transketolase n=1 Tax=Inhella proteolytica TaxID=2795029 RepID=A0A931J1W4_9BURK|nr:hypothetical protein [Inhella proteolytica]MBH9575457.1 hypothetical protein [Inhella proteolytica]